jgi:hypothetical protein
LTDLDTLTNNNPLLYAVMTDGKSTIRSEESKIDALHFAVRRPSPTATGTHRRVLTAKKGEHASPLPQRLAPKKGERTEVLAWNSAVRRRRTLPRRGAQSIIYHLSYANTKLLNTQVVYKFQTFSRAALNQPGPGRGIPRRAAGSPIRAQGDRQSPFCAGHNGGSAVP